MYNLKQAFFTVLGGGLGSSLATEDLDDGTDKM